MKILNWLMTAAFVFSILVQYNDPDPWVWMTIYGLATAACVLELRGKRDWPFPAVLGLVTLIWALTIVPSVWGKVAFGELFEAFEMKDLRVEQAREMGGLLIVATWMAVLTVVSLRHRKGSSRA